MTVLDIEIKWKRGYWGNALRDPSRDESRDVQNAFIDRERRRVSVKAIALIPDVEIHGVEHSPVKHWRFARVKEDERGTAVDGPGFWCGNIHDADIATREIFFE